MTMNVCTAALLSWLGAVALASDLPPAPGPTLEPPEHRVAPAGPRISACSGEAGPDESFLLVGEGLTGQLSAWGLHPESSAGRELALKVQMARENLVIGTLPERAYDGPVLVWAQNKDGFSAPVVLNRPQPWWCWPERTAPAACVRVFGRNLAVRPDFGRGLACLLTSDGRQPAAGPWLKVVSAGKYQMEVELPANFPPGTYQLWVHAGKGGQYGWGGPLALTVAPAPKPGPVVDFTGGDLQQAVDRLSASGGGRLRLPEGVFPLGGTLVVGRGVVLQGAGRRETVLQVPSDLGARWPGIARPAWGAGPNGLHNRGDRITYKIRFPRAGQWQVWLRYATEMSPWKQPGVSGNMTLALDGAPPVPLEDLPNTGNFAMFRWSRSAVLEAPAGDHELVWQNVKGGGIHIDAFVLSLDPAYQPSDKPFPESGDGLIVKQAEDVLRFETKQGQLPGGDRAAVWLAGDGAGLEDLAIAGSAQTNLGVAVCSREHPRWIHDCRVERVDVRDCEGKQAENCGVRLMRADGAIIAGNELWGRTPVFLAGVTRCRVAENRLVSVTRFGGNAEAYVQGRNETVRQCLIERNVFASPPGMQAGGPTGRRLIWISTGRGSVALNWIAENREDRARFGGVAGTDQNVGEMILFEACQRIAYFGKPAGADAQGVALPTTLAATPDDRLGSVKREQLAHDAAGNETPFWPPENEQDAALVGEAPAGEYFVTVLAGRGLGQTRRVAERRGPLYQLEEPWRVAPDANSLVLVHTGYWRNLIVDNRTVDGMTGIQLWIGCIENVLSDNEVARTRKPGLYLFGNCSTLASSMPATWNRGIGPLYFNHVEGTRCDQTSCGILLISGERHGMAVEFPRALGNVLRHNSMIASRTDGLLVTGAGRPLPGQTDGDRASPAVLGTIAEFNLVRDAVTGYRAAAGAAATLLRRNLAYFWYPVNSQAPPRVAFQVDDPASEAVIEQNSVEGIQGVPDADVLREQQGPPAPKP